MGGGEALLFLFLLLSVCSLYPETRGILLVGGGEVLIFLFLLLEEGPPPSS